MYLGGPDGPPGFVVGEDVQVGAGDKSQDEVFETAEAAGQAAGVFGGGGAPVEVGGQPGGGQFPVAGQQSLQRGGFQGGLARRSRGSGGVPGLDQQPCHVPGPGLPGGLEVVQALQIAQQVNSALGVQRAGQVRIPRVPVADDDPRVSGQYPAGAGVIS